MKKIVISSQAEYDALPADFNGIILIQGDAEIEVRGSAIVEVSDSATVMAYGSSIVSAHDLSKVYVYNFSKVIAHSSSHIMAFNHSIVTLYGSSTATAYDYSAVKAYGISYVKTFDSATVDAYDLSTVIAYGECSVSAYGSSRVVNAGCNKVTLGGLAQDVTLPANIQEYSKWYNISIIDGKMKLYKAVHKFKENEYYSDYDPDFHYFVGAEYEIDCDEDINYECSYGLHASHLDWAIDYSQDWEDAAILEVEVPVNCIVVPKGTDGKIRTSKLKVLREVPREEW